MSDCPADKKDCPCPDYNKEGLCDYPYTVGMSHDDIRWLSETNREEMRGE